MTSILFSETPANGQLHFLPQDTVAISYNVTPDRLMLAAHLKDNPATVDQINPRHRGIYDEFFNNHCHSCRHENNRRCTPVRENGFGPSTVCPRGFTVPTAAHVKFDVAPAIFQTYLNLANKKYRFKHIEVETQKAMLQGSVVENGRIKLYKHRRTLANTWNDHRICWGGNRPPGHLKEVVELFFRSPFNNDLTKINDFKSYCTLIKEDIANNNVFSTYSNKYNLLTESADALFMLHAEDNLQAFFWMLAAGFKPLKEAPYIIMVPLIQRTLEHEGVNYPGFVTHKDACDKEWFITPNGDLIGQM